MPILNIPSIFWTTIAASTAILALGTLIGRLWCAFLPYRLGPIARFYLAPALGLASLIILASLVGRVLPLGNTVVVPWLVIALLCLAIIRECRKGEAFRHALMVSVFGIVCGVSVLVPLFVYGALNAHNDTFTYLTHSNWLQLHAFGESLSAETVTPLTTQVALYQQGGFRMGGSFLLALLQGLLNLHWSYEVYPTVLISSMTACCLAIGFPLARALRSMQRPTRLALLALPAFSLGGLVFGANLGFYPQTVGLTLGASFLFLAGALLKWVVTTESSWQAIGRAAIPNAVLFSGGVFAYSELTPFLLVAVVGSGLILALRFHAWGRILVHCAVLFGTAVLLLNTELVRAYAAVRTQSGVVVGSPVEWSLFGYVAHAFGIHGGAWDVYQWTVPESGGPFWVFAFGLITLGLVVGLVLSGVRLIWRDTLSGVLMPPVIVLTVFVVGFMYFRYFVPSPFSKGVGQSWSQFKLSDWAHPFLMPFVILAICGWRSRLGKIFNGIVITLFVGGAVGTTFNAMARISPIMHYYSGVGNLNRFYLKFRDVVLHTCPVSSPIYLALGGTDHKFRQMATLYLYDREVRSDWMDDGYIYARLPEDRRTQDLTAGNCVVERNGKDGWVSQGKQIGPFRVGVFDGRGQIRIASVAGAYGRESDGQNWWHWVEQKVSFKLQPLFVLKDATQTKLHFEYGTRGAQTLTLRIIERNGLSQEFSLRSKNDAPAMFSKVIDMPPNELREISIETDGKATPLSDKDVRMAAWIVRNVTITPVSP